MPKLLADSVVGMDETEAAAKPDLNTMVKVRIPGEVDEPWVLGELECAPEGLAKILVDGMPGKLSELFEKLEILS